MSTEAAMEKFCLLVAHERRLEPPHWTFVMKFQLHDAGEQWGTSTEVGFALANQEFYWLRSPTPRRRLAFNRTSSFPTTPQASVCHGQNVTAIFPRHSPETVKTRIGVGTVSSF